MAVHGSTAKAGAETPGTQALAGLRFSHELPDAAAAQENPDAWITGQGDIQIGVVHATSMGGHGVGTGLTPRDRSPLTDWAAEALRPHLTRLDDFTRSRYPVVPRNLPKAPTAKTKEERTLQKAEFERERRDERRAALARVLGGRPLVVEARWQNDRTRDALIEQLAVLLGLGGPGGSDRTMRAWTTPELTVRLYLEDAGNVAAQLEFPDGQPQRKTLAAAISARRREIATLCKRDERPDVQAVVVKIDHPKSFRPDIVDPKFAARLGYADAGRLTKFVTLPSSRWNTASKKSIAHRALQAWSDVLRQLGLCTVPEHSVDEMPKDLDYVAVWMVKRRADGPTRKRRTDPVAVRISAADSSVTGWDSDSGGWVPYPELLLSLARHAEIPGKYEDYEEIDEASEDGEEIAGARETRAK